MKHQIPEYQHFKTPEEKRQGWEDAKQKVPEFTDLVQDLAKVFGKHERVVLFKDKKRVI